MAKVGLKDIAAQTGYSIATVSHALRNPDRVADATRKKVIAAAEAVGYTPNNLAVSLRTARSGNIVVIIPDIADSHNSNIIKAIEKVARARGYSVLLGDTQGSEAREREFARMTQTRQADGVILMSHRLPFDRKPGLPIDKLPPIVNGCEYAGHDDLPRVYIDDYQAAIDATNHLLDYGHRRIALISGDVETHSTRERLRGFDDAMAAAGVEVDRSLQVRAGYTLEEGIAGATRLMRHREPPTAIFCFSDEIAFGAMYALRDMGHSVPDDVSVMGFDNIPFARYITPPLTTIAQPTAEIGATCAEILLDIIDGKRPETPLRILPHELKVRESTRRISG
ncbi:LacI family transcriptional regulator [Marinihelvus fidelis]|uniref:LacI family transcriptional regulator n=1 Tax=Marinihelvus fidelis TaxID=2613842 RepID=A0A5N0T9H7_9GAMM|nr:LacI family DNA-binding transcriptional regulator [Marinihelvus fidelis]KAA9130456.1 LacI family transcriptional regulator [Marinihelvus fidelis]